MCVESVYYLPQEKNVCKSMFLLYQGGRKVFLKVCFIHIREKGKHVQKCVLSTYEKKENLCKIVF